MPARNFRKRFRPGGDGEPHDSNTKLEDDDDDDLERQLALEEVRLLQKRRERKHGISALPSTIPPQNHEGGLMRRRVGEKVGDGDGEKDDLVLQDTFAQETTVTVEDPNMLKYVEQELAKKKGKSVDARDKEERNQVDELYVVPEHLKVKKRSSEEGSTQWTTGIAEVQLPIEYKLRNIEETEAAKKLLQEKRLLGQGLSKIESNIPSSYNADYFQRGRDHAEKLRREHPELLKDRRKQADDNSSKPTEASGGGANGGGRRQAATDEFMLERFRKRERNRVMRR